MKRLITVLVLVASSALATDTVIAPKVPIGPTAVSKVYYSYTPQTATLAGDGTACAVPGGAHCTIVLAATDVSAWSKLSIYMANTGGTNVVTDTIVEASPNGTNWAIYDATTFASLATSTTKYLAISDKSIKWMRIEARSASGTTTSVWLSAVAP